MLYKPSFTDFLTEARALKKKIVVKVADSSKFKDTLKIDLDLNGQHWIAILKASNGESWKTTANNIHPVASIQLVHYGNEPFDRAPYIPTSFIGDKFESKGIAVSKEAKSFEYAVCFLKEAEKILADYRKRENTQSSLSSTYMKNNPTAEKAASTAEKIIVSIVKDYFKTPAGIERFNKIKKMKLIK